MHRALHTAPLALPPGGFTAAAMAAPRPQRVDPVSQVWGDLDVQQKALLGVHGLILIAVSYHGYKRHHGSIGWGLLWALGGLLCPTLTAGYALTQGFASSVSKEE